MMNAGKTATARVNVTCGQAPLVGMASGKTKVTKKIIIHTDAHQKKLFKNTVLSSKGNAVER